MATQNSEERNRLDHLLPRGYLEGFTIQSEEGRLNVFDIARRNWFEASIGKVAAVRGFYDYSAGSQPDATADQAFAEFEVRFPVLRRELVATKFSEWTKHQDFLVRYSQMLRARSDLFRQEVVREARNAVILNVDEVLETPKPHRPAKTKTQVLHTKFEPGSKAQRETLLKNMSITNMRAEIAKGANEFARWHWCLRFTTNAAMPVITSDNAVALIGCGPPSRGEAMMHSDTIFVFPVCWQACLIGSPRKFEAATEAIHPTFLGELHRLYLNADCRFAYSAHRLSWATSSFHKGRLS